MNQTHLPQMIMLVAIIALLGVRIIRMSREQQFRPARMWFIPSLFAVLTAWLIVFEGFTSALRMGVKYATGGFSQPAPGTDPQAAMAAAHGPAGLISMALLALAVGVIFGLRAYLQRAYTAARATL